MSVNVNELRQDLGKAVEELRALQNDCDTRGGESAEDAEKFAKMEKQISGLEKRIQNEEFLAEQEAKLAEAQHKNGNGNGNGRGVAVQDRDEFYYPIGQHPLNDIEFERCVSLTFQGWTRGFKPGGEATITQKHVDAAKRIGIFDLRAKEIELPIKKDYRTFQMQYRAGLDVATTNAGKETIPQGFVNTLERALLTFGGMRQVSTTLRTDSGNALPYPTMNDTSNKGVILAEATTIGTSVDPSFSTVTFNAYKYSSKALLMSYEITQDSAFDLGALAGDWLGERIGRIQNDHFTTGAGSTLPKGIVVAATQGKTAAATNTFTSDEVIDLIHSVDPAYREGASFMFHDGSLALIRKLKESTTNAYIWQPGLQAGIPNMLLGYPYVVNQSMSTAFTTGQKLIIFGRLSKYIIRDVSSIRLVRLDERYADTDQIAFIAFMRSDGNLLDAGTHPVKYLNLA